MSVQTEIARIAQAKTDIKNVVNSKVANTITNQTIDAFPPLIDSSIVAYKNLIPWIEGSGSNFTIDNAEAGKLDKFEIYGNTRQDTYSGKNLFKPFDFTRTTQAITFTYNEDGSININGTSTGNALSMVSGEASSYLITLQAGTYAISGTIENVRIEVVNSSGQAIGTTGASTYGSFTISSTTQVFIRANVGSGLTFNNTKVYPQLELSLTATEYEPYTGGIPSPNPDYPQEIEVVENEQNVNIKSKNLFNSFVSHQAGYTVTKNGITYTLNTDGTITANGTNTSNAVFEIAGSWNNTTKLIDLDSLKTYKLSEENNRVVYVRSITGTTLSTHNSTNETTSIISGKEGLGYIGVELAPGTYNNIIIKPQLEEGSTATSYESYHNKDYEIDLGDIKLCKIEDYKDAIFKNNQLSEYYDSTLNEDSWYIKKEIGKVVLDGSEDGWGLMETNTNTIRFINSNLIQNNKAYSYYSNYFMNNYFKEYNGNSAIGNIDSEGLAIRDNYNGITIRALISRVNNLAGFKSWLSTHNAEVYYVLATPTYETITNSTLINQLEAIETETGTNIFEVSNDNDVLPDLNILIEKQDSYKN